MTGEGAAPILLGCIADDLTGATDVALMLEKTGMRTVQTIGVPGGPLRVAADAVVVALKSRTVPVTEAVAGSLAALEWLRGRGARQILFKYCSTFDSTAEGNIGPVTDALMDELGVRFTIAVPSLPVNGRTQYLGHLFIDGQLLSESPLRHHPLNPMTDANLVRHLQAQTRRKVGIVPCPIVRGGSAAISAEIARLQADGVAIALVDVITDDDLTAIAAAAAEMPLVTAGSGLGMTLPAVWRQRGWIADEKVRAPSPRPRAAAGVLVLAGSCSARTLEQIRAFEAARYPTLPIDVRRLLLGGAPEETARVTDEVVRVLAAAPAALVSSSMTPEDRDALLTQAQERGISAEAARRTIEHTLATIATRAVERGTRQIVVAGGESAGAVVEALRVSALEIGTVIEPGVPHCRSVGAEPLDLVLKSGNFGGPDFFIKAVRFLRAEEGVS